MPPPSSTFSPPCEAVASPCPEEAPLTKTMISYGRQSIGDEDVQALLEAIRAPLLTQGPTIERFEEALAGLVGARYAVAVANGTAALILAVRALDLPPGSAVVTTSNTFIATVNAIILNGLRPVLCDLDPATANLDLAHLAALLEGDPTIKAILPVHFAGHPCPMAEIAALAARHDCLVLEDACHALASSYGGIPVGSCRHSALTVFSFHPVKHITTGEGGAITTNDRGLRDRLARLRNHGIVRDLPSAPPWFYDVVEVGYNFRLTDLQAALGLAQLGRSDHFLQRRRDLVRIYQDLLAGDRDLTLTLARLGTEPSWHLLVARLTDPFLREHKAKLFALCATAGVRLQVHYVPIHYHTCFVERFGRPSLPACEDYYRAALSLPIFPELEDGQVAEVVAVVRGAIAELREEQA